MKIRWMLLLLLLSACAPPTPTAIYEPPVPTSAPTRFATAKRVVQPTPKITKSTEALVVPTPAPWMVIAKQVKGNAHRAMLEVLWEDSEFKQETYTLCREMVLSAGDHSLNDACKRLRWGMELMDRDQLEDAIRIIDDHN